MGFKRRERKFISGYYPGKDYNSSTRVTTDRSMYFFELQKTDSWGHPYQMLGRSSYDIGGDFSSEHVRWEGKLPMVHATNGGWLSYDGPISHIASNVQTYPGYDIALASQSQLYGMGTSAIARTLPTNPNFSLAQALGELHADGIPKIIGASVFENRARHFKDLGDEYLNVEFGWKPFVSDVRSFARSVTESEKILTQFVKGSDVRIKRRWDFPVLRNEHTERTTSTNQLRPPISWLYAAGNPGILETNTRSVRKTWFEGCYTYHIPLGDSQLETIQRISSEANKLLGVRITPSVLWELMPWSWAIDWFGNIGDVIHNASALGQDGLVMRYGYIMDSYESITTYTQRGPIVLNHGPTIDSLSLTRIHTLKRRYRATPYGFGLDPASFTNRQKGIIAALGISRSGI